jgi:hypothetical protein
VRSLWLWTLVALWLGYWLTVMIGAVHADVPHAPADILGAEWNAEARDVLAHAWNAEADWSGPDHVAIGYVFVRRWQMAQGKLSFAEVVRRYVSAYSTRHPSDRHRRVLATDESCEEPAGWDPHDGQWQAYAAPRCRALWERVDRWARGELRDPCQGRPTDFGGAMDTPAQSLMRVTCKGTANLFYTSKGAKTVLAAVARGHR